MKSLSPVCLRIRRDLLSSALLASIVGLSTARAIPVLPITGTTSNDWQFVATGGLYYQVGGDAPAGTPSPYPFAALTNPFFGDPASGPRSALVSNSGSMLTMGAPQTYGAGPSFEAPDGSRWTFAPSNYEISLQIDLDLSLDQTISGLAQFSTMDTPPFADFSSITINGDVAWSRTIGDVFDAGEHATSGTSTGAWNAWTWTAPAAGTYTLSLNLYGDDQAFSSASFGDLTLGPASSNVPDESSTALLLGFVLVLCVAGRRALVGRNT